LLYYCERELKNNAEHTLGLGKTFIDLENIDKAIDDYRHALRVNPDYAKAYNNLGNALREKGHVNEAIDSYRAAIKINPNHVGGYINLGNILRINSRHDEALQIFRRAISINPNVSETYCNLGNLLKDIGQFESAADNYLKALQLRPNLAEAHFNYALLMLLKGCFSEGWQEYEWRFQLPGYKNTCLEGFKLPRQDDLSFYGKRILVLDEQGFGDTFQFVRYLPLIQKEGGRVIFVAKKQLISLLKGWSGIDNLLERPLSLQQKSDLEYDLCLPLLSLAKIFKTDIETIPDRVPYLQADPDKETSGAAGFQNQTLT